MDVLDKIAEVATNSQGGYENVPIKTITINKVTVLGEPASEEESSSVNTEKPSEQKK